MLLLALVGASPLSRIRGDMVRVGRISKSRQLRANPSLRDGLPSTSELGQSLRRRRAEMTRSHAISRIGEKPVSDLKARGSLLSTAVLWGTYPVSLKLLLEQDGAPNDPLLISAIRFALMALASPTLLQPKEIGSKLLTGAGSMATLELGTLGVLGTILNTASLETCSTVRVAILLSLINIFTPILAALVGKTPEERRVSAPAAVGCVLALFSTVYAISGDHGGLAIGNGGATVGDAEAIMAAFFYSSVKVRLGSWVKQVEPRVLVSGRFIGQGVVAVTIFLLQLLKSHNSINAEWPNNTDPTQWAILIFSALASGTLASVLQAQGQRSIAPATAQPIFATFTVWGTLLSFLILHEPISRSNVVGGLGVALASVVASMSDERMQGLVRKLRNSSGSPQARQDEDEEFMEKRDSYEEKNLAVKCSHANSVHVERQQR